MRRASCTARRSGLRSRLRRAGLLAAPALLSAVQAPSVSGQSIGADARAHGLIASAKLEQCSATIKPSQRSATFTGEMAAISGSARMAIRIDIQQRLPGEALFHTLLGRGTGAWRASEAGVRTYKYQKTATNLAAPAIYRGTVYFRWLNAKGRIIRHLERPTPVCTEPAAPAL